MVTGNFKNKIPGLAEGCMLSPPTVITDSDYDLHSMSDSPAVEIRMLFESMPIVVSVQIHKLKTFIESVCGLVAALLAGAQTAS